MFNSVVILLVSVIMSHLKKDICKHCQKYINIGQFTLECAVCDIIIHTKCYKSAKFENIDDKWMCSNCEKNYMKKYNPFLTHTHNDNEKFYDNELPGCVDSVNKMASILNSCKAYSLFNRRTKYYYYRI